MKFILALVAVSALVVEPADPLAAQCVAGDEGKCYLKNSGGSPCACPTARDIPDVDC